MATTTGQSIQYVTLTNNVVPDRVIFTYTNETFYSDSNGSNNPWTSDNISGSTYPPSSQYTWWWDSGYPSGYSWPHIIIGAIIITIIILMILIGNFLVMWAIVHDRTLKTTQNLFIASLAFADFMLGLVVIPFSLTNELMGYWLFGVIWCELYKAIDVLLCTASIISLCLISLDRYWSITRAVSYARQRTRKRAAVMIFTVWFISAVVSIPPLIGWKQPTRESEWALCNLSEDIGYVVYSAFGSFFIPAFIMVFVYFKIYQAAKQRARKTVVKPPTGMAGDKNEQKHSTESSITEHQGPTKTVSNENNADGFSRADNGANMTEETACDTAGDSMGPTSEDDMIIRNKRPADLSKSAMQEGEMSNLLATDSDSELPARAVDRLNKIKSESEIAGDTDSLSEVRQTELNAVTGSPVSMTKDQANCQGDRNNGNVQRFKILELRPNGNSAGNNEDGTVPRRSVIKTLRRHLFVQRRDSRRRKHNAARAEAGKPTDFQNADRQKRKLAKARERRATVVLGLVMAAFILCWLPFFGLYFASAFCAGCIPGMVFTVFFWIGYCNSALNPIIYTVFNRDFRRAFQKILFGKKQARRC